MNTKKRLTARIFLLIICAAISVTCLYTISQSFDRLARYPFELSEGQKHVILECLDDSEIDYMIDNQLKPEEFMDFIEIENFNIKNARLYTVALSTQKSTKEDIVNFVNKYRSKFNRSALKKHLELYSYTDLVNFFETEKVLNPNLTLVENPEQPYLVLTRNDSVYKYVPKNLTDFNSIRIQSAMEEDLRLFMADYESTLNQGVKFLSGYKSYDELIDENQSEEELNSYREFISYGAGSDEVQLGYTIVLQGQEEWLKACIEDIKNSEEREVDYDKVYENQSNTIKDSISWIEDNAYHYGFVIRYTKEAQRSTGLWYQPFVLRYVGKKTAKAMQTKQAYMENTEFSKELK